MSVKVVGTDIREYGGAEDQLPVTSGAGRCWVLRNGVRVPVTWERRSIRSPLPLRDGRGATVPLQTGRTWVELVQREGTPRFVR